MKTCIIVNAELPKNNNHKNDTRSGFIEVFENSCCPLLWSSLSYPTDEKQNDIFLTVRRALPRPFQKVFFTNYLPIRE